MADLIFVSLENWDEIWRRNQFLCAAWARRFPAHKILFVGRTQFLPAHLKSGTLGTLRRQKLTDIAGFPNIKATFLPKFLPNPLPGGRGFNEIAARKHIHQLTRQIGLRQPLLWLNPDDAGYLAGHMNERGVIYDITDDWELAAPNEAQRQIIATRDRALCRRADLTVVCSQALAQSRREFARRLLLLPNGVDATHYAAAGHKTAPDDPSRRWPFPVFGYTGTLHPKRIDLDLVLNLARAHPQGSVVLAGPNNWSDNSLEAAARQTPNLHLLGPVPYAQIPQTMAAFDVCIVPHQQSAFVESLNPIKLWEYLACGKPIVSTDVAGFRDYPQFCRVAASPTAFLQACQDALQEVRSDNREQSQKRRQEAAQHSWESRLDDLLGELRACALLPPTSQNVVSSAASTCSALEGEKR